MLIDLAKLPRPEADRAAAEGDGAGVSAATEELDRAFELNSAHVKDEFGFSAC